MKKSPSKLGIGAMLLGIGLGSTAYLACPQVEQPQETKLEQHVEIAPGCFPSVDCYSKLVEKPIKQPVVAEKPPKENIDQLVNDVYAQMTDSEYKIRHYQKAVQEVNKFDHLFEIYAKQYGVPKEIAKAHAIVETRGQHYDKHGRVITGSVGEVGMMQLRPSTAKWLKIKNPRKRWQNIKGGIKLMGLNLKHYDGDIIPAITAYNAGRTGTNRLIKKAGGSKDFTDYRLMTENPIIRRYTLKVLAAAKLFEE
ncbi:transglycosylase SLT domain-containing protein [Candidatus Woesearchaeota archaeon]|nr:transglycosylase SLT domain-containing protein [Candidatus Woesearchaeota archaeon]